MKFTHKLTNQVLTIKKDYESVVLCHLEEKDYTTISNKIVVDVCVCLKENLIPVEGQQTLF